MNLFNFLRRKKIENEPVAIASYFETNINDDDLKTLINNAISVFQSYPDFDHNQLVDKIKTYRDDKKLALALFRFIPIAYCRLFIPEPKYADEYILYKSPADTQSFSFSADRIYQAVWKESKKRFASDASQNKILPILYFSSDFNAINEALNKGSDLKNLICSSTYFVE